MRVKHLLLIAILVLTVACSSDKEIVDENLSESRLYRQAQDDLNNKSCNSAVTKLEALRSCYPFDRYAEQIQLELTYANYKSMESEAAYAAAERFIRLYPQHPSVGYAYYLKGLFSPDQSRGLLAYFLPLDMTERDPGAARDSFGEFVQLTSRFPNNHYVPDAKVCMARLHNLLAVYEVHVGRYYLKRQAYVAVADRGRYVVENFQEAPAAGDSLVIMIEAHCRLGLDDPASTSLETLKLNYPDNASLKDDEFVARENEANTRSWLAKATLGLIEGGEPSPHMETQVTKDVIKQYEGAEREIPAELKPENQDHSIGDKKPESDDDEDSGRSWWSYMTSGLSD